MGVPLPGTLSGAERGRGHCLQPRGLWGRGAELAAWRDSNGRCVPQVSSVPFPGAARHEQTTLFMESPVQWPPW